MRIWDQIPPSNLCRQHLLGEHRELHAIYSVLARRDEEPGYLLHPETRRWDGRERALWKRHELLAAEMKRRGYQHRSPLASPPVDSMVRRPKPLDDQLTKLRAKRCSCRV